MNFYQKGSMVYKIIQWIFKSLKEKQGNEIQGFYSTHEKL